MSERVPTGITEFDRLLDGGFPAGSVVVFTGCPGAGKTTLSARFIYEGATTYGEHGVYACFAESKKMFMREMARFGWDFEDLTREKLVSILDLSIATEIEVQMVLNQIMDAVMRNRAKRLVVDSITALSVGLKSTLERRRLIRLLYKLVQKAGCTTIMITDMPWGTEKIGEGMEELIADGIVLFQSRYDETGLLRRYLRILKMRATKHVLETLEYSIGEKGIEIKAYVPADAKKKTSRRKKLANKE